jgi:deoxyhypusine synthase
MGQIKEFLQNNFLHFNAAALVDAAKGYEDHINKHGKMMISLAGAMSTAEIGKTLAEMIRQNKVHIICCTGANLEEDIFNLVAHDFYKRVPNYRDLTPQDEADLLANHLNRVTDTCIPEAEAFRRIESHMLDIWKAHSGFLKVTRKFPHEYFYQQLQSNCHQKFYLWSLVHKYVLF